MAKVINTPLTDKVINNLKAGDRVLLNGIIYTGRDAAHKRLVELIEKGEELPWILRIRLFIMGPCPAKPGK